MALFSNALDGVCTAQTDEVVESVGFAKTRVPEFPEWNDMSDGQVRRQSVTMASAVVAAMPASVPSLVGCSTLGCDPLGSDWKPVVTATMSEVAIRRGRTVPVGQVVLSTACTQGSP